MFSFDTRIRYSELNSNLKLPLVSLINLFQDSSIFHSEKIGKGRDFLSQTFHAWIVTRWHIEIYDEVLPYEEVTISTWPTKFDSFFGYRDYTLTSKETGKVKAAATATWVLLDTKNMHPARITSEFYEGYELKEPFIEKFDKRKIMYLNEEYTACDNVHVVRAHIDSNGHVNKGQYLSIAEDILPKNFTYQYVRADYRKSAILGDTLCPKISIQDDKCIVLLTDKDGNVYTVIEFLKNIEKEEYND